MSKRHASLRATSTKKSNPNGLLLLLLVAVVTSAIGVIYSRAQARHLFQDLGAIKERHNAMTVEWDSLLLEESTFAADYVVEQKARRSLGMIMPDMSHAQVLKP